MIRRHVELSSGEAQFWLIAQDDHARLSGELAGVWGNELFAPPERHEQVIRGTAMHDAGWPLHDDAPELNDEGLPSDVFETPVERAVEVWEAGAARAEAVDTYAGLLVSIHVQRLAGFADREPGKLTNRQRFQLIRFRNDQAQRQMRLRSVLGMHIDRPLDHGLPLPGDREARSEPAELALIRDVSLLQAMDLLSLCICCTQPPAASIGPVPRWTGGPASAMRVERVGDFDLRVRPWPFGVRALTAQIPCREVPARRYHDAGELAEVLGAAEPRVLEAKLAGT